MAERPSFITRLLAAGRALVGKRDPFAGVYGNGAPGGFAGGQISRLTASLSSWSASINADMDLALPILRARARSLAANNEHGRRFLSLVAANIVGRRNPRLQVRAMRDTRNPDPNATPALDKAANDAIEVHYERWGRTADITGRHKSLYALQRTIAKAVARDGEALIRRVRDRKLPYGYALQLLEADRLDDAINLTLTNGNIVRQGVEIDTMGRAVAYHVRTAHPGENYAQRVAGVERVPAEQMIHLFLPERAEQVRGVTWFHAVIIRGSIIHKFEESAVVAAHIGASKVAALERADDAPAAIDSMADAKVGGIPQMSVEAGELFELPPGYKLSSWNPDYPHQNFESFLKACLRGLAAGLDVAAHNLTGDMTEVNYSSARIAELTEREHWMTLQDWFIESFCQPVFEDWLASALLLEQITFPSGSALPAARLDKFVNAARFQGRRWPWVDPAKDGEANKLALENRLTSRTRLAAEQGDEFEDIADELEQEQVLLKSKGLVAEPPAPAPAPKPDPNTGRALATVASAAATVATAHSALTDTLRQRALEPAAPVVAPPGNTTLEAHFPEAFKHAFEHEVNVPELTAVRDAAQAQLEGMQATAAALERAAAAIESASRVERRIVLDEAGNPIGTKAI